MPPSPASLWMSSVALLVRAASCLKGLSLARRALDLQDPAQSVVDKDVESKPSSYFEPDLAPQDGGRAAWSFLLAATIVDAVTWSIPFSYGVLITDYLEVPEIASQPNASTLITLVGTLSSGIIYCSGFLVYPYMCRNRSHIRPLMWLGMTLCWVSILVSSYSQQVYVYLVFQGLLYGIGGGLMSPPSMVYLSEWFFKRRGRANGILFAGTPVGGLIMPFVLPPLVKAYGLFVTLRILSIASLVLLYPCLLFIRPRLPEPQAHGCHSVYSVIKSSITLRDTTWWLLVAANIFQGFAFFVPLIYVPILSSALNLDSTLSSLALALLNGFSAAGPLLVGFLSDYFMPWPMAFILSVLSLLCTVVFWGVIGDVAGVMLFSVAYGFIAGGWSTLWTSFIRRISREDPSLSMSMYGLLMLTRGLGNILSSPISSALAPVESFSAGTDGGALDGFALDGGRFTLLIAYVAACYAAAALVSVVGWRYKGSTTSSADEKGRDPEPIQAEEVGSQD